MPDIKYPYISSYRYTTTSDEIPASSESAKRASSGKASAADEREAICNYDAIIKQLVEIGLRNLDVPSRDPESPTLSEKVSAAGSGKSK